MLLTLVKCFAVGFFVNIDYYFFKENILCYIFMGLWPVESVTGNMFFGLFVCLLVLICNV